ncbi:MAG: hypothetical protein LBJ08_03705 [Bifidobacteriaceae bacterium]|jgi:hypothetical protein|nr:hypothetical protein [Bifidobacteriaceae bacterium]
MSFQPPPSCIERTVANLRVAEPDGIVANVIRTAFRLGAIEILGGASMVHGFTEWTSRGPSVRLSDGASHARRRMILAHECAHLLLDSVFAQDRLKDWGEDYLRRRRRLTDQFVGDALPSLADEVSARGYEGLCDEVGYELMLPWREAVRFAEDVQCVDDAIKAAEDASVSVAAFVCQANRGPRRFALLRLGRSRNGVWLVTNSVAAPRGWHEGTALAPQSQGELELLSKSQTHMTWTTLETDSESERLWMSLRIRGSTGIALYEPC